MPVPSIDTSGIVDGFIAQASKWLTPFNNVKTFLTDLTAGNAGVPVERLLWGTQSASIAAAGTTLSGITKKYVIVDTDGSPTQNLATISGPVQGHEIVLEMANAGRVVTVKHGTGNIFLWGGADVVLAVGKVLHLFRTATGWSDVFIPSGISTVELSCNARLTLTSGTPVTTADVTAATHVYVTPYLGNRIALYNGSIWVRYAFSEIDINLSGFTADKNSDVFCYDNGSGVVIAERVEWTNDTTRATALVLQDGVWVKSGSTNKRYIGTFRTTSTIGQCEDSLLKRYVWNNYNRVRRTLQITEATDSWTYATATWHAWNASNANRVSFVVGVAEEPVRLIFSELITGTSAFGAVGIGLDSTSSPSTFMSRVSGGGAQIHVVVPYEATVAAGFHFLQLLEFANGATVTYYGDLGAPTNTQYGANGSLAG